METNQSNTNNLKLFLVLLLLFLVVVFAVQNSNTMEIKLIFWSLNIPLAIALFFAFFAGIIVGILAIKLFFKKKETTEKLEK